MTCTRGCCRSQAEHFRSINLATRALVPGNQADRKLSRDLRAYKSMIDQGLEPHKLTGAYELERDARSAAEIEGRPDVADYQ